MKLVAWIRSMLAALEDSGVAAPKLVRERNPVVLVHGIYSDSRDMARIAHYLRRNGWEVFTPDMTPADGRVDLDQLASQLAAYAECHVPGRKFDLVGFSLGGPVSRYYLQRLGGLHRVERFVTIAAPHHGTFMANSNFRRGGRQMRPGSDSLLDLARDSHRVSDVQFTSFYTPLDLIIVPARSSGMVEPFNVHVWSALHPSLILEKLCLRADADTLLARLGSK